MKLKILGIAALLVISVLTVKGIPTQKESFKVSGKCGMCETRIEKAALSVKGVESAEWDKETGNIAVEYDSEKADKDKIQKAIAKAGHDTELYTANDKVYEKLPGCCKYERVEAKAAGCCPSSSSCPSAKE
jgi:mercuric ion binding protein